MLGHGEKIFPQGVISKIIRDYCLALQLSSVVIIFGAKNKLTKTLKHKNWKLDVHRGQ